MKEFTHIIDSCCLSPSESTSDTWRRVNGNDNDFINENFNKKYLVPFEDDLP